MHMQPPFSREQLQLLLITQLDDKPATSRRLEWMEAGEQLIVGRGTRSGMGI